MLILMIRKMAGWAALLITAVVCVATSPVEPHFGFMQKALTNEVVVEPGQILVKRYKVLLAAGSNQGNSSGVNKQATLFIAETRGCVLDTDGRRTCPADGGAIAPVDVLFLDGTTQMSLLERCGVGVDCEQTVQVRVRSHGDQRAAVNVVLRVEVRNAGSASEGLTIVPE